MEKHTLHLRDERGREVATVSPASALRETSLRSASLLSAAGETVVAAKDKAFLFTLIPILALLCNYGWGSCLSYVGTEGEAILLKPRLFILTLIALAMVTVAQPPVISVKNLMTVSELVRQNIGDFDATHDRSGRQLSCGSGHVSR